MSRRPEHPAILHMKLAGDSYNSIDGRLKSVISWPEENNRFPRWMDAIKRPWLITGWLNLNHG